MQTLRKLPTMEPKTNETTLQKWKGTEPQSEESKMALAPIDAFGERLFHEGDGRRATGPNLQSPSPLVQQHTQAIGSAATSLAGGLEQGSFGRTIDHIEYSRG